MSRPWLWLALALHVVLATAYATRTPDFEGPDENSHYEYTQHLANAGGLPLSPAVQQARGLPQTAAAQLAHHPPLYYALLAGVLVATGRDDTVFGPLLNPTFGVPDDPGRHLKFRHGGTVHPVLWSLRLVSVLLGALTVWLVHHLGRAVAPAAPRIADLAALLVACLPMVSFLHGVLNSDVLATTLAAAATVLLVRLRHAAEPVPTWPAMLGLGTALGLALLTKLTTLFLVPLAAVALLPVWRRARAAGRGGACLTRVAAAAAVTAALFAPVAVRNLSLYGDPLALAAHDAAFAPIPPELRWRWFVDGFLPTVFPSVLGTFGWFSLPPDRWLVWLGGAVALAALLGPLLRRRPAAEPPLRSTWLLVLALALVFAGTAHFNWRAPQPQGRLLFPALGPAAVLLAAGLVRLTHGMRARRWFVLLLPITALAVHTVWFAPHFAPTLAPAPPDHRALVGGIVAPTAAPTIAWQERLAGDGPRVLRWRDDGAAPGQRYTLYAFDAHGRVWLATHEWTGGAMVLQDGAATLPDAALAMLPRGVEVSLRLRRVPRDAASDPATLAFSPPHPFRRD